MRRLLQKKKVINTDNTKDKLTSQRQRPGGRSSPKHQQKPGSKILTKIDPKSFMEKQRVASLCSIARRTRLASGLLKRACSMRLRREREGHLKIGRTVELVRDNVAYGSEKSKLLFLCSLGLIPKDSALKLPVVLLKSLPAENKVKHKEKIIKNFSNVIEELDDEIIIEKFIRRDIGLALERINDFDFRLFEYKDGINGIVLKPPHQSRLVNHGLISSIVHPLTSTSPCLNILDPTLRIKSKPTSMAQTKPPNGLYQPQQQQQQKQQQLRKSSRLIHHQRRSSCPSFLCIKNKKKVEIKPISRNSPDSIEARQVSRDSFQKNHDDMKDTSKGLKINTEPEITIIWSNFVN